MTSLKESTVKGIKWSAAERFATQGVNFIINIVLARLLLPSDFGLIAMVAVFIQFSQAFIDSGFSNALIQRKDRSDVDYCTVFYFNIAIACLLYVILYFSAPTIGAFYNSPQLIIVTRILCLSLIFSSIGAVNQTHLVINVEFKSLSVVTFLSSLVSGIIAIVLAYCGAGVWSLVWQTLIRCAMLSVLLFIISKWRPKNNFSLQSFKSLFSYSSKLLVSSLIHLLYYNLYTIVIGKKYTSVELGYYNRAELFARFPSTTLSSVFSRVAFPVFSKMQDADDRLRRGYSNYIIYSSAIIFPIMFCLIALAQPLVLMILTDKWLPIVPLMQILCLSWATDHLCSINLNVLFVKGRSDLALRLEVIKKAIATLILLGTMNFGLTIICWGLLFYSVIAVILNTYYTKPLIGLSIGQQFWDYIPIFLISAASAFLAYVSLSLVSQPIVQLLLGGIVMLLAYFLLMYILQKKILVQLFNLAKKSI